MKFFQPGDKCEVDLNGGLIDEPKWVEAVVTEPTHPRFGWTVAKTTDPFHPPTSRRPGWAQDEIREVNP